MPVSFPLDKVPQIPPRLTAVAVEKIIEYLRLNFAIARSIDRQLMLKHVGEYQALHFHHTLQPSLKSDENYHRKIGNHAKILKNSLCEFGANRVSKLFCKDLVEYYESL